MSLVPVSPPNKKLHLVSTAGFCNHSSNNPRTARLLHHPRSDSAFISSALAAAAPTATTARQLIQSADAEHKTLHMTLRVAEDLFTKLIIQGNLSSSSGGLTTQEKQFQQSINLLMRGGRSSNDTKRAAKSNNDDDDSGGTDTAPSDAFDIGHSRIAISCLFLERLCAVFPRHNASIRPIAEAIVRSIFVPDTDITRELVGDLECPIVLKERDDAADPSTSSQTTSSIPPEVVELLKPYARKTYAAAFSRISAMLKRYSKTSHSLEVRLKRQAQVFERTLAHWRRTLLRSVFVAWRSTIRRRVFLRAKYRAIFSRLREDECKARAIRLWHQRATRLRKAALADAAMQQEMSKLKMTSESLQQQIVSLLEQNATLSRDVADLERQRQLLQQEMQDRDRFVVDMNHRTAEAERLGTELLNSVLMKHDPPPGITPLESLVRWGHEVIEAHGSIDGNPQPLAPLLSDDYSPNTGTGTASSSSSSSSSFASVPFSALGTILAAFDVDGAPPREAILQMHINPDQAPQLLVQYYGRVTQRPCIVSEAHLRSKQRGVLLLFLASLMRFASSWMFGPPPLNLREKILEKRKKNAANNTNDVVFFDDNDDKDNDNNNNNSNNNEQQQKQQQQQQQREASSSSTWMDRVRTQQRWVVVSLSAMNAALLIASDRPRVLSVEEQEDEEKYCGLLSNPNLMEDLLPSSQIDERLAQVIKSVRNVFPEIRRLYLTYSSPTMSIDELWRLLKDAKIVNPAALVANDSSAGQLTKKKLQTIISLVRRLSHYAGHRNNNNNNNNKLVGAPPFHQQPSDHERRSNTNDSSSPAKSAKQAQRHSSTTINTDNNNNNNNSASGKEPSSSSPTASSSTYPSSAIELSPLQFTVALLHIALFEHRRQVRLDNPDAIMFETFMLDNVIRSMRDHALRTDVDQFRHVVRHPLVQAVVSRHKIALRRVFRKFANCDDGESMNRNGFHQMARTCMWMSKTVTIETLNDVFRRVQKSDDVYFSEQQQQPQQSTQQHHPSETIDLSEWIECLCALASFVFPNPFKPLWEKLGVFVEEKVLVALGN